jgi:glucose-6-phosphate isomerase
MSEEYMVQLLDVLNENDYAVVVVSKSGTTTEPAIAFRIIRNHLEIKYGKEDARRRIFAVTDRSRGALKTMAVEEGYKSYVIPDDVGGRYSVLTPVGLLPIAAAGFGIRSLMEGAAGMRSLLVSERSLHRNPALLYAAVRNALFSKGYFIEVLANYDPSLQYFTEWWKQLYGESEGKEGRGIFPAGVGFTTDLHSMGQYIQDGKRMLFETVITAGSDNVRLEVPGAAADLDGLNFLKGRRISEINRMAQLGTMLAHVDGGVPNIQLRIPEISEHTLGEMIFFFEFACAISGYVLGVNPFDQPGVEA